MKRTRRSWKTLVSPLLLICFCHLYVTEIKTGIRQCGHEEGFFNWVSLVEKQITTPDKIVSMCYLTVYPGVLPLLC